VACRTEKPDGYVMVGPSASATIYVDGQADDLIQWAVNDLVGDLEQMTARNITVVMTDTFRPDRKGIYIGEVSDRLMASVPAGSLPPLQDQWETFAIKPYDQSLLVAGSDIRGTVYAIFELAERIGISPWKWWADVTPLARNTITLDLPPGGVEAGPSVRYRGIFLNDEDWGLQPWAAKTFEPETGDIGPKTYEKIFQLLLRLKANTIWPAMHPSTKAFFRIPGNREMAAKYHISIGTSHAEPMLRNNVDEWDEERYGDFNYFTNSDQVKAYWQERISEAKHDNMVVTLGMRGIHDSGMKGHATQQDKVALLETIISDQRQMLTETLNQPIEDIPQVFTIYKEVLELYDDGLTVPEDVTLVWTDDNYGHIRRLSNQAEQQRPGGSGIYYHVSYWGRPHDYLWLSTTQAGLIWYEMSRAYQQGAQRMWIANVGDIKPAEYAMEFFLDLAWDINSINETTIHKHLVAWSDREFGGVRAADIADVMDESYRLACLRKPEFMGWSQTEPTTITRITDFRVHGHRNEVQHRIDAYADLVQQVEDIKPMIPAQRQEAYFQLVEYPIKGAAWMNHKFLFAQLSALAVDEAEKRQFAKRSQAAFDAIADLTEAYNHDLGEGKWRGMMSMHPRNLPAFAMPTYHLSDSSTLPDPPAPHQAAAPIFIQAHEYTKAVDAGPCHWGTVEGLGYSNASVTLFPFDHHSFSSGAMPHLQYTFKVDNPGPYTIEIRCMPTHSNAYDHEVWVEVNDEAPQAYAINTKGRSEAWKESVLRNYVPITHPVTIETTGTQTITIYVNQTGIVLDQMAISPGSTQPYHEIPQ
jgi:hypothetical protein